MATLHYANRTEALLERLAANVAAFRAERGPWEPVALVVPNRNVQIWLQQGLSDALGIAANLAFRFLDQLWRESLPVADPPLRLLDRPAIQGQLLALFGEGSALAGTGFEAYLAEDADVGAGPGPDAAWGSTTAGRKAVQLSGRLARLYEEYLLSRPDWMAAWEAGRTVMDDPREEGQRRLWRALRRRLAGGSQRWITLPEYLASEAFSKGRFPGRIFVFGLSQMARTYHDAFRRLAERRAVDLYVLNPCGEFWEDVPGPRQADEEDPYGLLQEEHLGLQRWGRPGRENIHLLNDLVDCDFEDHFQDPGSGTLLARLQSDLLHRVPTAPADPPQPVDGSLRVAACASPRREAEAVASAIWEQVRAHGLRFSEVAVVVPPSQKEAYLGHLRAAFEACHRIPWVAGDEASQRMADLLDGAERLLRLPLTAFTRADVLAVAEHPAMAARFPGLEGGWADLCEDLGVVRGLAADGPAEGGDLWTWDMGARRLALGALMPPGELDLEGLSDPVAPPEEGAAFLAFVRGLLADARRLRDGRRSPAEWGLDLGRYLGGYLGGDADAAPLARIQRALEGLDDLEAGGLSAPRLAYGAALDLAMEALAGLRSAQAALGQGVLVASYAPMRALPFQALFLMGLGEGVFPGPEVRNPLDLRSVRRRPGDVSRPEQDRYLFLESLLCARRHLHLSYVRRDPLEGADLEPSPLLEDLRELVGALAGPGGWKALLWKPPVDRHDPAAFAPGVPPEFLPEALREARAALRSRAGRPHPRPPFPPMGDGALPERLRLTFGHLRRWLCDPLQGGAAVRLGLREEDEAAEEAAEREEEPFDLDGMSRRMWLRTAFWEAQAGADLENALARGWRRRLAAAQAPVGAFAEAELARGRALLAGWQSLGAGGTPRVLRFGAPGTAGLPGEDHGPFLWTLGAGSRPLRMALEGATPPFVEGAFLLLSERKPPAEGRPPDRSDGRALLTPWVAHLALRARGLPSPGRARVLSVHEGKARAWEVAFPPLAPEAAEARLRGWIEDLLAGDPGPLPIEALLEGTEDLEAWIEAALEASPPSFSSLWGPVPGAAELPPAPDWEARAARRLGDFLRACRGGGAS